MYSLCKSIQELILLHLVVRYYFRTEEEYVSSKAALEDSDWWTNSKFLKIREYFLNQWMSEDMPKVEL